MGQGQDMSECQTRRGVYKKESMAKGKVKGHRNEAQGGMMERGEVRGHEDHDVKGSR